MFSYHSLRVSNIYMYLSFIYYINYYKKCISTLKVTNNIYPYQEQMYLDFFWFWLLSSFNNVYSYYIIYWSPGYFVLLLSNHYNIQQTWVYFLFFWVRLPKGYSHFWSFRSIFCARVFCVVMWPVFLSDVLFL